MGVQTMVFGLGCIVAWSLVLCAATPTSRPRVEMDVEAPYEQCYSRPCNRVTHYCDEVMQICASCEDDCHPSRITDDEQAIKECQRVCDWYYYIKSLNEGNKLPHPEESTQAEEHDDVAVHKYYVTIIVVLVVCFTIIVIFILAMFACYVKRQTTRRLVVSQETRGTANRNIYKPFNLEKTHLPLIEPKNNSNETSLKLLTDDDSSSLEVRTGQQESIRSVNNRSEMCHSRCGPSQLRSGKLYSAQVHRNNASLPLSPEDLSTQPLVK